MSYIIERCEKFGSNKGEKTYFEKFDGELCYDFSKSKKSAQQFKTKFGANRKIKQLTKDCSSITEYGSLKVVSLKNKKHR